MFDGPGLPMSIEVEALRQELTDMHERLDFAERVLAREAVKDERALRQVGKPGRS